MIFMGITEAIAKGFGTAKKNLGLIGVLFAFGFIFSLITLFVAPPNPDPNAPPSPATVVTGIVFLFVMIFLEAGKMAYVRDYLKTGSAAMANFTAGGAKYYLKLLLLGLVISLIVGVLIMLAGLCAAFLQGLPAVGVVLAILFGALAFYFLVTFFLSPYAAVVDDKSIGDSLKTSTKLVKRNILTLLGITLLLVVIGFGIGLILGAVLAGVSFLVKAEMPTQVIFSVLSSFVNAFLGVAVTGSFMSFYLSQSDRNNI
jgi:hypothetical protein